MNLSNNEYHFAGFFSSSTIGFIHFQDIIMAVLLGFFGALGAYLFKKLVDKTKKKDKPKKVVRRIKKRSADREQNIEV